MCATHPALMRENNEAQHDIALRVAREILWSDNGTSELDIGPLRAHNFSFTFQVTTRASAGLRRVFVKIPKTDLRERVQKILPITSGDRRMAQEEEASLRLLNGKWNGGVPRVDWIKLCGTIPDCNALVTECVEAGAAFETFRRLDLRRRLGFRQDARRLRDLMSRLGAALSSFHQADAKASEFRLPEMLPKLEFHCRQLTSVTGSPWPSRALQAVESLGDLRIASLAVPTLKGLDMRNVMIDRQQGLHLLDPGKTKITHREADLARFIMTYRILFWGSKLLPFVGTPDHDAEDAFLDAYFAGSDHPRSRLFDLFLLKEQLKHWNTALDSLRLRGWPQTLTRLTALTYVNPFYTRQIAAQLRHITGKA